jgi:peptide deformylase
VILLFKLIKNPKNPILHTKCEEVKFISENFEKLINQMYDLVKFRKNTVGIAAPQFGIPLNIFVASLSIDKNPTICINPEIINHTGGFVNSVEGCLSIPMIKCYIKRYNTIEVKYYDTCFNAHSAILKDSDSKIFQHELDHLNGILMTDNALVIVAPTGKN